MIKCRAVQSRHRRLTWQALRPEDTTAAEVPLTDVTIENVLADNLYNDLNFIVNNKLMILQSGDSRYGDCEKD